MSDEEINAAFQSLWSDVNLGETFPTKRPLLAHYTSIAALESMMEKNEIWFSNPLYMNDLEELRFVIHEGANAFRQHEQIRSACGEPEKYAALCSAFEHYFNRFSNEHAFDTYVFCLAEHDPANTDGLLSMWRGYGGNGSGAALVFDTTQLGHIVGSPLIISNVTYASEQERLNWIGAKLTEFAVILANYAIPKDRLHIPAYLLFERFKMFALFTKHCGFSEEREWRAIYLRERDVHQKLDGMLHYAVGRRGIEPKLKFKVQPIDGLTSQHLSLEKIVAQIILGPTVSSPLAISSVGRMLEKVGKSEMAKRLFASTTPFRPQ